jgi:phage minor structural protein
MSIVSPFRVDIIYQGVNVGTPTSVLSVDTIESLDKIGTLTFRIPSQDNLTQYLVTGTYFNIYDELDGFLGTFLFKSKSISDNSGISITTIECYDVLKELTFETVGFNRNYEYEDVSVVIEDLLGIVSGWNSNIESGLGKTTIDYQGESVLRAIDEQRDRQIAHYRLGGLRLLEFGEFGDLSDIVFTNMRGQNMPDYLNNPNIALVTGININQESDDIYNKIIPLGFGQGVSQLTIELATLGEYDVQIGTNQDGSNYYYIQDDLSASSYGKRTRILSLPNLRALDNNEQNIINAANALKLSAEAYISRNLNPKSEYSIEVKSIRKPLKVGQLVKIDYKGISDNYKYVEINDYFYVMDISKSRSVDGNRSYNVTISSTDDRRTSDTDVIVDVVRDLRSIGVHIPATLSYFQNSSSKRIKGNVDESLRTNAEFTVRMKEEILYLNRALLQFTTSALQTDAIGMESSGAHRHRMGVFTGTSTVINGNVTNSYTFATDSDAFGSLVLTMQRISPDELDIYTYDEAASHTHALEFGLFSDTTFPQNLGIIIDGTDYTTELLEQIGESSFAPLDSQSYTYEVDITSILNLNLKQNHTIVFYANSDTQGSIEANINCLVTIQPIRID